MSSASWRSDVGDLPIRLMILRKTQEIFQSLTLPCDPDVVEETVNTLAPRLEAELYRTAASLEEYGDPRTVRQRLELLAPHTGHVRPLEAIWLQALLNANPPTNGAAPSHELPAPIASVPSQAASLSISRDPPDAQDSYTRSLMEVKQYLDRYDAESNRDVVVFSSEPQEGAPVSAASPPLDLTCSEALEDL